MANYSTTANVVLSVNGKQAQQMLRNLERDAKRLEQQIAKAAKAGDKATMKKLQRELTQTQKTMQQLQGSAKTAEQVLARLDKATPKELQKTLRTLQQQLNGIKRGTAAWDAHVAKIKAVKAEIAKLNASLVTQKSFWERMNTWLNNCQTALLGLAAAVTGLVMAGRKAVNAFAEMDEQLANTRKYTGMTAENVEKLNEVFKQMDTRTPRDKLNELAQEAGRLGMNTLEAVQGYVEAADIINVALVDLGDGATQTIAKLTNIFGVQEMLGVKESMLAVGSTVNVLSQNCTASKPYLVEFAQRMAGIGSQAGLTIPQILAFGAVLDANGQKVEMSATAIQKVIMNLANKNQEFANVVGLDAELLNQTLKRSAKEGLLMFLEALQRIGQASDFDNATMVLAPALKDMGLDAARVSQVLSTLAQHLDEVKWQMGEADKAFAEASSATREYEIFNNTAQAAIDKAKKRVSELAIELGQKLYPIMKHIYTTSGIFLRVLNTIVTFVIQHKTAILALTVAIVAHTIAVNASTIAFRAHYAILVLTQKGTALLQSALILAKMAFYALTGQINKAKAAYTAFHLLTKSTPWGIVVAGISAAVVGLVSWINKNKEAAKAQEEERKKLEEQAAAMHDISESSASYAKNEITQLKALYTAATDEAKSKDERIAAAKRLQKLYPQYFGQLKTEAILVGTAKAQYDDLTTAIIASARARAAAAKIEENEGLLLDLEMKNEGLRPQLTTATQRRDAARAELDRVRGEERQKMNSAALGDIRESNSQVRQSQGRIQPYQNAYNSANETVTSLQKQIDDNQRQIDQLNAANRELAEKYNVSAETLAAGERSLPAFPTLPAGGTVSTDGSGNTTTVDRFAAEKDWRESMEASARISYATGEKDYIAHTKRMDEILVEYYEKILQRTDLGETERLTFTAQWREAQQKQQEHFTAESVEQEQQRYSEELATAKQAYIDGQYTKETYDIKIEELEIEHQQKLVNLYKEGTKDRAEAEARLTDLLIQQMQRRQQETATLEAKYAAMKKDYFGDNPKEAKAKYDADIAMLDVVYQRELQAAGENAAEKLRIDEAYQKAKLALQKKYGLLEEEDMRNRAQKINDDFLEWLEGDGGKALTGSMSTLVSGMSAIFSQLSSLMQAELEIQTAAINKRYDAEISRAEGNSYQVKKLEAQKQAEIAKAKNEANRKMFAMQVIQAVAQTAQNALSAYGSAAAIPVVGYILAPIAAAMAVAAGAIQIAAIKKQQQASEAQGYSEGGFTPEGAKDSAVGVVHAGEWVASQKLTHNPKTRPLLEALDNAQRNNTIGSITAADVSRSITAPMALASAPAVNTPPVVNVSVPQSGSGNEELAETLSLLRDRLNEPIGAVVTVSGDQGIARAQDEYDKLMRNKSPKSKK